MSNNKKISKKYVKKKSIKKRIQYGGVLITSNEKKREDKKVSKILNNIKDNQKNITNRNINKELENLKPESNKSLKNEIYHDVVDIFKKTKNKSELTIDKVLDKILKKFSKKANNEKEKIKIKKNNEKEKIKIKKIIKYTTIAVTSISAILTGVYLIKKKKYKSSIEYKDSKNLKLNLKRKDISDTEKSKFITEHLANYKRISFDGIFNLSRMSIGNNKIIKIK
tara:strand:- start:48 stop:719 length:672 start_codon:yes stop_codon:yes gene_type:complete